MQSVTNLVGTSDRSWQITYTQKENEMFHSTRRLLQFFFISIPYSVTSYHTLPFYRHQPNQIQSLKSTQHNPSPCPQRRNQSNVISIYSSSTSNNSQHQYGPITTTTPFSSEELQVLQASPIKLQSLTISNKNMYVTYSYKLKVASSVS